MARRRKPLVTVRVAGRDGEERPMRLTKAQAYRAIWIEEITQGEEEARAAGRKVTYTTTWVDMQVAYLLASGGSYEDWLLRPESVRRALAEDKR